jgi:hypothetical protein
MVKRPPQVPPTLSRARVRNAICLSSVLALLLIGVVLLPGPSHMSASADMPTPSFVQQISAHKLNVASVQVTPTAALGTNDRLIVEVGIWNAAHATAKSVTDAAGNTYTEIANFTAADGTEQSVWTAPITAGGGTKPAITVTPTSKADVGVAVVEYSGLSVLGGNAAVDTMAKATGLTGSATATTVSSGATGTVSGANELAVSFYSDSGFGDTLTAGDGLTKRVSVAPTSDMELLVEDRLTMAGDTPNGGVGTGKNTYWLMSTIVFRTAATTGPSVPGAPTGVIANPGNGLATLSWSAPADGGSPITSYTVTPFVGSTAQPPLTVSPPALTTTISGLTNGTAYTFTVSATNALGTGPASAPSSAVTPGQSPAGQWTALATSPIVAVHDMLLPNGKFLQFDGWQQPQPTYVFDPAANTDTEVDAPDSIFCAGNAYLPDGRVITIGGYGILKGGNLGIKDTAIFDPATSTWSRAADMNLDRWYPTLTELADGRYVAISGNSKDANTWADTPEVYNPSTNTWTLLARVSTPQVHEEEYPFSYLAPNGKVFTIGPSEDQSFFLDVDNQTWTPVGTSGVVNGSSVMYQPGKILYSGGAPDVINTTNSTNTTAVIDLTAPTPTWRTTAPMAQKRVYHTLTMLADGRVLSVGGEATSDQNIVKTGVLPTEIWDPNTETWSAAAPIATSRNYHSTAALMPDGRVMISGGGHPQSGSDPGQFTSQIYSPSYLFNGARPTITSATAAVSYNAPITVTTPDAASIGSVNLVSLAADTHQIDMNQHFVPLSFTAGSGSLTVQSPTSSSTAPPGNYMLFILSKQGVPSVSAPVRILPAPPSAPGAPSQVTAAAANGSATVSWSAPANGGAVITSYTVTPYVNGTAQSSVTVNGNPPANATTVTGLTNGTTYSFTVSATNVVGTGPASAPSNAVTPGVATTPAFVQQASDHRLNVGSLSVTPTTGVTAGNRLVVEVGVWNAGNATAKTVTDSAGDTFTEVSHFAAADGTEQSVWTAPITATTGTKPTITAITTTTADIGVAALEYSGLSTASGLAAVDVQAHATGKTGTAAATVQSGATAAAAGANELAVGFYNDSGFGDTLTANAGFTGRVNVSPTNDMEFLVEDLLVGAGTTANAVVGTGKSTYWTMNTVVFKTG